MGTELEKVVEEIGTKPFIHVLEGFFITYVMLLVVF